jgi:hypothetical protein
MPVLSISTESDLRRYFSSYIFQANNEIPNSIVMLNCNNSFEDELGNIIFKTMYQNIL